MARMDARRVDGSREGVGVVVVLLFGMTFDVFWITFYGEGMAED